MHQFLILVRRKFIYFSFFLTAVVLVMLLLASTSKISGFILVNGLHEKWLDALFTGVTFMGDGLFSILVAACLLLMAKYRSISFHIIIAYIVSGIAAQVLKRLFAAPRPKEIIGPGLYQSFIEGMGGAGWDSFPSGHTTSVFALATILACYVHKKAWGIVFLVTAILVGYSRVYLGLHFPADVLAGSMLGTTTAVLVYLFVKLPKQITRLRRAPASENDTAIFSSGLAGN